MRKTNFSYKLYYFNYKYIIINRGAKMKRTTIILIFLVILSFSACILRFPEIYKNDYEFGSYRIILHIQPDDAHVLLNGKFIGEAYEFSTLNSALKLSSLRNSIIVKKRGFVEEEIDLSEYQKSKIVISMALKRDRYFQPETVKTPTPSAAPPVKKETEKYKVVKEKKVPEEISEAPKVSDFIVIELKVNPSESSIYLDGKFWGVSPKEGTITNFSLEKGKHKIEIVKPGYKTEKRIVNVKTGKKIKLTIKMLKK